MERVSDAEANAYYASRARGSRIGAWAAGSRGCWKAAFALEKRVAEFTMKFGIGETSRAPNTGPASGCCRSGSSSGSDMPSACMTATVFHRVAGIGAEGGAEGWRVEALYP